jgi:type II secretory pathway predicted ATPase ExeA
MYEQDFGLTKRLFLAKATGGDVFVAPQTAQTMVGLKKALLSQDATDLVSGPAGTGKTTLVSKSLEALAATHKSIRLGRMRLGGADILEFLLEELGAEDLPRGPIRQFGVLREQLRQLQTNNMRVVVVVEDALHTGAETLAELEALTAADAGDSGGAAIVLMGDEGLPGFLQDAELARLAQRIRLQHSIKPMCAAELRGYLMHCFRLAETDFEHIFDATSAALLHDLSGGIPRIANNIVESAMTAAAAADINPIPSSLVATIAKDEFHLEAKVVSQRSQIQQKSRNSKPSRYQCRSTHLQTIRSSCFQMKRGQSRHSMTTIFPNSSRIRILFQYSRFSRLRLLHPTPRPSTRRFLTCNPNTNLGRRPPASPRLAGRRTDTFPPGNAIRR